MEDYINSFLCCTDDPPTPQHGISPAPWAVIHNKGFWNPGDEISYHFYEGNEYEDQSKDKEGEEIVRQALQIWDEVEGKNLKFIECKDPTKAFLKISFDRREGSKVKSKKDILKYYGKEGYPTMNFGIDFIGDKMISIALHEIGHVLGFRHEHQHPDCKIVWSKDIYNLVKKNTKKKFGKAWKRTRIYKNMIERFGEGHKFGPYDELSIMHYGFPPEYIDFPEELKTKTNPKDLSDLDKAYMRNTYPYLNKPMIVNDLNREIKVDGANEIMFISDKTAFFTIDILRDSPGRFAFYEKKSGDKFKYIGHEIPSLSTSNKIKLKIEKGKKYIFYNGNKGNSNSNMLTIKIS